MLSPEAASDRRRDWALAIVSGGAMAMTLIAVASLWFVRGNPTLAFYLGLAAQVNVVVALTGILALLVKRRVSLSKSQINISDFNEDLIPRPAATEAVDEALADVPAVNNDSNDKPR